MKNALGFVVLTLMLLGCLVKPVVGANDDYRLGSGDLLKISAFGYPDLASDVRVTESGNITFPLIGEVAVGGLSTHEVESLLSKRLTDGGFIPKAQMSVLVTEYQSQKIAVIGQVIKPGQYAQTRNTRLLDLLAEAGGPISSSSGDLGAGDQVTLLRHDGSKIDVDLVALLAGDPKQNLPVSAGDTIIVPKAPQFYIYGEVQHPGVYRLERGMTISRAVSAGGGLTPRGTMRRTVIERRDVQGHDIKVGVNDGDLIQPNDVVRVRQSFF